MSFYMPEKYNRITVPIKEFGNKPVQVTWGSMTFSIEKVDSNGFIISTDAEKIDKLRHMGCLYHRDGNCYEPSSQTAITGDLDKILKNSIGKISFEEWLKRKKYGLEAICLNISRGLAAISRKPRKINRSRLSTGGPGMRYQEVTLSSVISGLLMWPSSVLPCLSLPTL